MRKLLLPAGVAMALAIPAFQPANALLANQAHLATARDHLSDVVQVKRSKFKGRPPGWSRGKAWWKRGGRGVPPGQR